MRVHLFAPSDPAKLGDAIASSAEALWFEGRSGVDALKAAQQPATKPFYIYFGALNSRLDDELDAVMAIAPQGIIVPVCHGTDVQNLGVKLAVREAELGLADGTIRIIALINAPSAIFYLGSFGGASARLTALAFDVQAFATGIVDLDAPPLGLARDLTLLAAKAAGVAAILIDAMRSPDDYRAAKRDGFDAVAVREPADVAATRAALSSKPIPQTS